MPIGTPAGIFPVKPQLSVGRCCRGAQTLKMTANTQPNHGPGRSIHHANPYQRSSRRKEALTIFHCPFRRINPHSMSNIVASVPPLQAGLPAVASERRLGEGRPVAPKPGEGGGQGGFLGRYLFMVSLLLIFHMHWDHEPLSPFGVTNHRTIILLLLGEKAGMRAGSLQPRHEALTNRSMVRENLWNGTGSWRGARHPILLQNPNSIL
jgi:hypothetical protein